MRRVVFNEVEIRQGIREHDTAVITATTRALDWFNRLATGTPIRIDYWSTKNNASTFVGYITNVRPRSQPDGVGRYERQIVAVGASRVLRETARATYRNMTAPEIASAVARKAGLTPVIQQHPLRRPTVIQDGETHWEFLSRLAKRTGFVLQVDGTSLHFASMSHLKQMYASRAPYLTDHAEMGVKDPARVNVRSVDAWSGTTSEDAERLSDLAEFTAVSPDGKIHTARRAPDSITNPGRTSRAQYVKYLGHGVAAHTRVDADLLAKGAADNGQMAFQMHLDVAGNPGLKPYRPVMLDLRDRALNGYWIVKEVTHHLSQGKYSCDLIVANDSVGVNGWTPSTRFNQRTRDVAQELMQGHSPDVGASPRLIVNRHGFVAGVYTASNTQARWTAS